MGDPKKSKKTFERPKNPWVEQRLSKERDLMKTYGLKNKKELWKTEAILRKKRQIARHLLAINLDKRIQREKELIDSLKAIGVVEGNTTLDDILGLGINDFLERRLQTMVWRKGLANTISQARQFITHGFIAINNKKVTVPSFIVGKNLENNISYFKNLVIMERKKLDSIEKVEKKKEENQNKKEKINEKENDAEKKIETKKEKISEKENDAEKKIETKKEKKFDEIETKKEEIEKVN